MQINKGIPPSFVEMCKKREGVDNMNVYVYFVDGDELVVRTDEKDLVNIKSWLASNSQTGLILDGQGQTRTQQIILLKDNIKYVLFTN